MDNELKPCPYCGGKAHVGFSIMDGMLRYHVVCNLCYSKAPSAISIRRAIENWADMCIEARYGH